MNAFNHVRRVQIVMIIEVSTKQSNKISGCHPAGIVTQTRGMSHDSMLSKVGLTLYDFLVAD